MDISDPEPASVDLNVHYFENGTVAILHYEREPETLFAICMIVLILVGLFGNLIVLLTILVLKEHKKSLSNWYILQITVADTLTLCMLPFAVRSEIMGNWEFSLGLCKFTEGVIFINYYASVYFLVVMSLDRYIAITKTFNTDSCLKKLRRPIAVYLITIFGWSLSVLLSIQIFLYSTVTATNTCSYDFPTLDQYDREMEYLNKTTNITQDFQYHGDYGVYDYTLYFNDYELSLEDYVYVEELNSTFFNLTFQQIIAKKLLEEENCKLPNSIVLKLWIYSNFFAAFLLPFFVICYLNWKIVNTTKNVRAASTVGNSTLQRPYQRKVSLIIYSLVTLFFVCWFPWYIEKIVKLYGISISRDICRKLSQTVRLLSYLYRTLDPYLYNFFGTNFRQNVRQASKKIGLTSVINSMRDLTNN